jgi:hypothetical protein
MTVPPVTRIIRAAELRDRFNTGGFRERVHSGSLTERLIREGHPSPPLAHEPECTWSQLVEYVSAKGRRVAEVHQYLRPDGTLGLSGKPDPKGLLDQGVWYISDLV